MKYILVIFLFYSGKPAISTAEFNSRISCETAQFYLNIKYKHEKIHGELKTFCIPK